MNTKEKEKTSVFPYVLGSSNVKTGGTENLLVDLYALSRACYEEMTDEEIKKILEEILFCFVDAYKEERRWIIQQIGTEIKEYKDGQGFIKLYTQDRDLFYLFKRVGHKYNSTWYFKCCRECGLVNEVRLEELGRFYMLEVDGVCNPTYDFFIDLYALTKACDILFRYKGYRIFISPIWAPRIK